jgi:hypothetical protein
MSSTGSINSGSQISQLKNLQGIFKNAKLEKPGNGDDTTISFGQPSKADQSKFLDKFTKEFGADAAKGITNKDGSVNFEKMADFIQKKMADGTSSSKDGTSSSDPTQMMMFMMPPGGATASGGTQSMDKEMSDGFKKQFGADALKSVSNSDGTINKDKLIKFMNDKMNSLNDTGSTKEANNFDPTKLLVKMLEDAEKSSSKKASHSHNFNKGDSSKILDKFTKEFGADAAKDISNKDGTVNGDKLASYLENKLSQASPTDKAADTSSTEADFTKLLQQINNKVAADNGKQNNIFDILFGKSGDSEPKKTGHLVDATA